MGERVYQSVQTHQIIEYVRNEYGDELEFLWESDPTSAIWRNPHNRKWYGLLMRIPKNKLGIDSDQLAEVMNLRFFKHEALDFASANDNIYPGYHMNKQNWFTIILDGSLKTEQICALLDQSYQIVAENK